jgi:hypothetical protein
MSFADAQAVARRVAARVSARIGEPLWLRDYPVDVDGEIGRVVLGVSYGTLHRAVGVVSDLGAIKSAAIEVAADDGPALRGFQLGDDGKEAALAEAIVAAIAARGEAWPLGLLDAGYGLYDVIGQRLGVADSGWRLTTWGEWDDRASGVSVELYGEHAWTDLISVRSTPAGVAVAIPAPVMAGTEHLRLLATPGALVDALGGIVDDVRAAVDARAAFRARPDGIAGFGRQLLEAVREAHALRGSLRLAVTEGSGFPRTWPTAAIERVDDRGGHRRVALAETAAGVAVTVDTAFGPYPSFAAAAPDLARILAEVRAAADRLRPDQLVPGRIYQAIAPIRAAGMSIEPGTRLLFEGVDHVPREGFAIYRFTIAGAGDTRLELTQYADADVAILARLHEVLAPADPS